MMTASDGIDRARPFAEALVEREHRKSGSRMTAYAAVANAVGVSESWLRKLLGRQPVVVAVHEYLNLAAAYDRLCARIEAEELNEKRRTAALREAAHAALASDPIVVAGKTRAPAG